MEATAPPIVDDFEGEEDEEDDEEEEDFEEEYDGDEALEINDEAAGNGDELVEDVILEMSGEAKIAPEAAVPESPEPEADFTALQAQLQAEVEEAETKTAQETQAAESTDKKTSGNKRRSSSDDHEAENIEQLVGKVIGMGLRQRPRSSTRNSQRAVQKEGQQVDATAEEEVTVDLILPYNLRPRKKKRLD
jgi:hypothetical protein